MDVRALLDSQAVEPRSIIVQEAGSEYGPFTAAEVIAYVRAGNFTRGCLVRLEGDATFSILPRWLAAAARMPAVAPPPKTGVEVLEEIALESDRYNVPQPRRKPPPPKPISGFKLGLGIAFGMMTAAVLVGFLFGFAGAFKDASNGVNTFRFEQVKVGMSVDEVEHLLGSSGKEVSASDIGGDFFKTVQWNQGEFAFCQVNFKNGRVFGKTQVGLR